MAGRGALSIVAGLIGLVMSAGCGPPDHAARLSPAQRAAEHAVPMSAPAGQGTLRGTVERSGGRDPRSGSGGASAGTAPVGGDPLQVRTEAGELVTRGASTTNGQFELTLPPGTYVVSEEIAGVSQRVQVTAGAITTITLLIPGTS